MNYYKTRFFGIEELVNPNIFKLNKERSWSFLDTRMLWTLDELRKLYGRCTINNWSFGGRRVDSGLREFNTTTGAAYSAHKFGKAFDCLFSGYSANEIRNDMKANPKREAYKYITRVEEDVSWLHIDNMNISFPGIYFFRV